MLNKISSKASKTVATNVRRLVFGTDLPTKPGLEPVYQRLFERDLARSGIEDDFYPVGSAANYGLLYVLLRISLELRPRRIVELGAGQTSVLLDRLFKHGVLNAEIVTYEHNPFWASAVQQKVQHKVVHTELADGRHNEIAFQGYGFSPLPPVGVQLLVIDGPPAGYLSARYARLGALALVKTIDPAAFAIVIDDAERPGEDYLTREIEDALSQQAVPFQRGTVIADKRQNLVCGGEFLPAAFY